MIKIYHNNRCRKSREALQYLEKNGIEIQIIEYLKNPLSAAEWKNLFSQIDKPPQDMIRTQEALWKSDYKGQEIDDTKLFEILTKQPKLIKRPIVLKGQEGILAQPLEALKAFLSSH